MWRVILVGQTAKLSLPVLATLGYGSLFEWLFVVLGFLMLRQCITRLDI